jgi:hypothetical protein
VNDPMKRVTAALASFSEAEVTALLRALGCGTEDGAAAHVRVPAVRTPLPGPGSGGRVSSEVVWV